MTSERITNISKSLSPYDARQARRIVGYLEYGMALAYFDELLQKLTADELQAIDEFVADHDAFTVFTNLSRRVEAQPSSLSEVGAISEAGYAKRGLAWVMGLARVEYAAILAAFTTTPDPFLAVKPSRFEMPAYTSLLLDGSRMHYWSLAHDPLVKKVTNTSPQNPTVLSYSRRLGLARKMLTAVAKAGLTEMSPYQYRELAAWKKNLDGLHAGLLAVIQGYLASVTQLHSKSTFTTPEREFVNACNVQLQMERRELKAGTAKVFDLSH